MGFCDEIHYAEKEYQTLFNVMGLNLCVKMLEKGLIWFDFDEKKGLIYI